MGEERDKRSNEDKRKLGKRVMNRCNPVYIRLKGRGKRGGILARNHNFLTKSLVITNMNELSQYINYFKLSLEGWESL